MLLPASALMTAHIDHSLAAAVLAATEGDASAVAGARL